MKLTVGMAHHTDFSGVYFTIQHIRQTNRRLKDIEFVVVDNSSGSPIPKAKQHAIDLRNFIGNCHRGTAGARYIELPESESYGTTQPRNRVFQEATGDIVVCMDCHVLPEPFALDKLLAWYEERPDCLDLIAGPILNDDMSVMADSFANEWRDQMWGIWNLSSPMCLADGPTEELPIIQRQEKMVCKPNGQLCPYEIGAMGLGLFGCLKKAWLGFNEHFRGFGGEEWYIHEKFRRAGRKCLCLPWLRWNHRFGRPDGISYTISMEHKVRNYILGHNELGSPLDPIYNHFVTAGHLTKEMWDWLVADPIKHIPNQAIPRMLRAQGEASERENFALLPDASRPQPPEGADLDGVFEWCKCIDRDLNKHLDTLREWSGKCQHVTEFSERRESTVGLLAGRPKVFVSYNKENDLLLSAQGALHHLVPEEVKAGRMEKFQTIVGDSLQVPPIEPTDLLFIDTQHTGPRLYAELLKHGPNVSRAIVVHDTQIYGEKGDGDPVGLNHALRQWTDENPDWFVAYYTPEQYGLTVISRNEADRPEKPIHAWLPGYGPGTELKRILASMGIDPEPGCDCNRKAELMDVWGADQCETNFDTIVGWLREGEERWGWKDKWAAGAKLLLKDPLLAFSLDPSDPFPVLIKTAIKRAKKEEKKRAKKDAAA